MRKNGGKQPSKHSTINYSNVSSLITLSYGFNYLFFREGFRVSEWDVLSSCFMILWKSGMENILRSWSWDPNCSLIPTEANQEESHPGTYRSLQMGTKILSSPPLSTITLYFSHILETVFILSNTNSLKGLFHRVLFQREKYHLPGPSIPESLYSRVKLLIPGSVQISSWVFMVLYQTSTFSHNMTWIVWKRALCLMPAEGGLFWKAHKRWNVWNPESFSLEFEDRPHFLKDSAKFTKLFISLTQIVHYAQGPSPSQTHLVQMYNFICKTGCIWQKEEQNWALVPSMWDPWLGIGRPRRKGAWGRPGPPERLTGGKSSSSLWS